MSEFQLSGRHLQVAHVISRHSSVIGIPIMSRRIPFLSVQQLEGVSKNSLSLATTQVVKMKANTADAPYVVQKGALTHWKFALTYATVDQFLVMAHEQLAASRLPYADRKEALQVHALQLCCCFDSFQPANCPSLLCSFSASLVSPPSHPASGHPSLHAGDLYIMSPRSISSLVAAEQCIKSTAQGRLSHNA